MGHFLDKIEFLHEKTRQIYSFLPAVFVTSVTNSIILSYILWDEVPHWRLITWLTIILTLTMIRLPFWLAYRKSENKEIHARRWMSIYLAGLLLSGLSWGAAGLLIFPEHSVGHQIFLAFVLGGMVAGSIASTAPLQFGFYLWSIPALVPIIVRFLSIPDEIHMGMGVMSIIFLAGTAFISRGFHSSAVVLLKLRRRNEQEIERRRQSEMALIQHKEQLEEIVSARTKDLERTNQELRLEIIEKQNAQKSLQASENKLKKVLDTLPIGVWFTDIKGRIIYGNPAGQKIWKGARAGEAFDACKAWWRKTGEPITSDQWGVARAIENREESHEEEIEIECFDGTHKIIHNWAVPILDMNGEVEGALEVNQDVTERITLLEEREKIKRLESVGTLAGGIAHDFNNILVAILGNINLALLDKDLKEQTKRLLAEAEKASLRAKDLTQQLLTFARGGEPVKEKTPLERVIRDSANFILSGHKAVCRYSIPDDLWLVDIDKGQISQVIQNIVLNASEAMPDGGIISVTAENIVSGTEKALPFAPNQKLVKISIQDRGVGMPQNILERIFDPYFSTKAKGSGLGLAITQSIINKHNGHISVKSRPGEGSTFTIYLPASEQAPVQEQKAAEGISPSRQAKILLMDDEEMVRNIAKEILTHLGHEVTLATHGKEAVQLYHDAMESGRSFDLVILDLTIPGGIGGKEVIREILGIDPKAQVVVSSGYSNDPVMADFKAYGFCGALVKPFQIQDLNKVINQALDEGGPCFAAIRKRQRKPEGPDLDIGQIY